MAEKQQLWFFPDSPAAALAEPLGERYTLRPMNGESALEPGVAVVCLADIERGEIDRLPPTREDALRVVALAGDAPPPELLADSAHVFAVLPRAAGAVWLERVVAAAFENIELARRERETREELARTEREMEELNRIGVALSSERDIDALFCLILEKTRQITRADAGSLYLVEETGTGERRLRFTHTQNDSKQFPFQSFTIPITEESMAGYVALTGEVINLPDAYQIPAGRPYRFNPTFDWSTGYRTRSVLTLPMRNQRGELLGVLQLINAKRHPQARLDSPEAVAREVAPFSERAARLALSLASQAAVAYEKNKLYRDIEALFEGFVKASVLAIEQRDPTTSGHSFRVAGMTVGLAEIVDRCDGGPFAGVRFTLEQMKEIRYAALLHDFGKVGVKEEVLVKAKKLYPPQIDILEQRFEYLRKDLEARLYRGKLDALLRLGPERAPKEFARLEADYRRQLEEVDDFYRFVLKANEPTVLPEGDFARLNEIAARTYADARGRPRPVLRPEEVRLLSIPKGSLDDDERRQIEAHALLTYNFLMQIPWTREIRQIPTIALSHHEKLNGTGYPHGLRSEQIPLPTKMMTICDIYDALSAADRPYKKAVSVQTALDILDMSVRDGELDPDLFRLFLEAKIYERAAITEPVSVL